MAHTAPSSPPHLRHSDLTYIERLLVHAQRRWVADQTSWTHLVLEFSRACGPRRATCICEALEATFETLGRHTRRQIRLYPLLCSRISPNEIGLLNLLAAHQSRDTTHVGALIDWLVPGHSAGALRAHIDIVTRALTQCDYLLAVRHADTRPHSAAQASIRAVL